MHIDPHESSNVKPFANAGTGGTYPVGTQVSLDAVGSLDPDGAIQSYRWRVTERPTGSVAQIASENAASTSLTLDAAGSFAVELTVTDDAAATATSLVRFHAISPTLNVDAGSDQSVLWRTTVQLSGSASVEPGFSYDSAWMFLSRPAGSTATLSATAALDTTFVPDREGEYVLRLTASTPYNSVFDDVTVTATIPRHLLEYVLVDAEYSNALDRFVIVSDIPPKLRVYDPEANSEVAVTLPEAPVSISLEPSGLRAAVAHTSSVSVVNLQTMTVEGTYPVSASLGDVVFGADNRVHCFHINPFNSYPIYTIDLANGNVSQNINGSVYRGVKARLHPSGTAIYGATNNLSPSDFEKYDVSTSPVRYVDDSPYHGDYALGGELWFTDDGGSIIMRSGNIFYASNDPTVDMTYRGTLGEHDHTSIDHSAAAGKIATVVTTYDALFNPYQSFLRIYDDQQYGVTKAETLPDTPYNTMTYRSVGRFIAFNASSTKLHIIARLGSGVGVAHVVYTFDP